MRCPGVAASQGRLRLRLQLRKCELGFSFGPGLLVRKGLGDRLLDSVQSLVCIAPFDACQRSLSGLQGLPLAGIIVDSEEMITDKTNS